MKIKTSIIIGIGILIAVGGIAAAFLGNKKEDNGLRTTTVERTDVVQDVTFTGRLRSKEEVSLGFAVSGQLTTLPVQEGDLVEKGTVLARIDARTASLDAAKSTADRANTQEETLTSWNNAKQSLSNTHAENNRKIEEQKQVVRDRKVEMDAAQSSWQARVDESGDESYLAKAAYSAFLTARTAYNSAVKDLSTLQKTVQASNDAAEGAAKLAEQQHIAALQTFSERRAAVVLSQHSLVAPFSGTVTKTAYEQGEYVTGGTEVLRLETVDQLEISADVTETDAIKLEEGMKSTITFDALASTQSWDAEITYIAPSATFIEGVPTYEVRLTIPDSDNRLRPGLTSNVVVHADIAGSVLAIPRRAVSTKEGKQFVTVIHSNKSEEEREVTTGLVGSSGTIEITSGLSEGETVIVSRATAQPL